MAIRARIALFGAAVVTATVLIFGVVVYTLVERGLIRQQEQALRQRADQVAGAWSPGSGPAGPPASRRLERFLILRLATSTEGFIELLDAGGTPLLSTAEINGRDPQVPSSVLEAARGTPGKLAAFEAQPGLRLRVFVRECCRSDAQIRFVVTGQTTRGIEDQLARLRWFLAGGGLLSVAAALAASWLLAGRALRPLETMAQTAEQIGHTHDLTRRLPGIRTGDEVSRLTRSFNEMLQRLQDAYQRLEETLASQRRFVADASHELRTPLTSIRSNAGLLLLHPEAHSEDRLAAMQDIASESERMSRLVQDLLTLARADAGQHLERGPLDLGAVVQDVFRQAQNLYPNRRLQLHDGLPTPVTANADALKQLLWILIDNAVKHTQEGGQIQIRLTTRGDRAELAITDDGSGIPPADLKRIFERFHQVDAARADGGAGLGLAIARWIVQEHEGRVVADNNPDRGATFTVELPLAQS